MGYVRLNGSYNILKSINFQFAGIPSLCKEKKMNLKSMSYTGKVLWTVWELDVEDYEILSQFSYKKVEFSTKETKKLEIHILSMLLVFSEGWAVLETFDWLIEKKF